MNLIVIALAMLFSPSLRSRCYQNIYKKLLTWYEMEGFFSAYLFVCFMIFSIIINIFFNVLMRTQVCTTLNLTRYLHSTVWPRSLDSFKIVTYYITWVKTFRTYCTRVKLLCSLLGEDEHGPAAWLALNLLGLKYMK